MDKSTSIEGFLLGILITTILFVVTDGLFITDDTIENCSDVEIVWNNMTNNYKNADIEIESTKLGGISFVVRYPGSKGIIRKSFNFPSPISDIHKYPKHFELKFDR